MERLSVLSCGAEEREDKPVSVIDDLLAGGPRPVNRRKPATISNEHLKQQLEGEFLAPSASFPPEWLDRFQQYVAQALPLAIISARFTVVASKPRDVIGPS